MTESYFPADVSVRFQSNDYGACQNLLPLARQLLFRAQKMQDGGQQVVRRTLTGTDGSFVQVYLNGPIKQLYIRPAPTSVGVSEESKPTSEEELKTYINDMISGVVRPGVGPVATVTHVANPDGDDPPTVPALNQFHPDQVTAAAYLMDFDWQQPPRLGISQIGDDTDGATAISHYPKPTMYSGSMKRVVSAVLGVGRTVTETFEYISGELPASYPDYVEWNQYDYTWLRTHGIHKSDDGSVWLVEVSKLAGLCAMPLPIFEGTDEPGYLNWLYSFGDSDTIAIVLEFGGLPTGEPFPEGADLTTAIANGKVVQFLTPDDLEPFYRDIDHSRDKSPYFADCGWAFSESGKKICNTVRFYSRPDIVGPPSLPVGYPYTKWVTNGDPAYRYFDQVIDADGHRFDDPMDRYMRTELWEIELVIASNPASGENVPVGIGAAIINLLEETYIAHDVDRSAFSTLVSGIEVEDGFAYLWVTPPWWFPQGDSESVDHLTVRPFGRPAADITTDTNDWANSADAPVFAFYVGEEMDVVRYTPFYPGNGRISAPGYFRGGNVDLGAQTSIGGIGPYDSTAVSDVGLVVPAYNREAYALIEFKYPSTLGGSDGDVYMHQFMPDTLRVLTDPDLSPQPVSPGSETTFPGLTWLYGWLGYHPLDGRVVKYALSYNTGPLEAYVISDGATVAGDTQHYVQAVDLAPLLVPDDTPVRGITFVGSCS